ncbi:monothiol glutaredoxin-S5 isoform X2 [Oryza brachyantha]|uniref:monothiol glutaredoxin-S5 isoform X2 n=1 Tax=Oryza brachyantha TaxID=4533 RepID=UPI001ADC21BD|nr:monothiol glutaredoxin-S5 isoform X2 [Oryza brachyantha]
MYQAIPYSSTRPWLRPEPAAAGVVDVVKAETKAAAAAIARGGEAAEVGVEEAAGVRRAVAESPVLVVGRRGCCLIHVVKRLLQGLGVNPAVHEVAGEAALKGLVPAGGEAAALPAVFVGGKLLGGLDRLMAVHISGELVPILKKAGALWL